MSRWSGWFKKNYYMVSGSILAQENIGISEGAGGGAGFAQLLPGQQRQHLQVIPITPLKYYFINYYHYNHQKHVPPHAPSFTPKNTISE